ncbi:MAG TPA: ATP synthase subunit I [Usitatibacter sp.]|nr:ATP synthase subunit I [Usitatibacter sp.]
MNGFASLPRPIRIVLQWQLIVTAALSLVAALLWGIDGALSAVLGGGVNIAAGGVYGWRVSRREARSAAEVLATMFRAEGIKILLIFAGLLLVLKYYNDVVHAAFFATFVITVGVFSAAIAVRDTEEKN